MSRINLSKFLIPAFYVSAVVLVVFYAWNNQSIIRRGGDSPIYRDLMEHPSCIRRGFGPGELSKIPELSAGGEWVGFKSRPLRVKNSDLILAACKLLTEGIFPR
jgi:hypothetical protein